MAWTSRLPSRLRRVLDEYGAANAVLLTLQQLVRTVAPTAIIERRYIVAQPVPARPAGIPRRGQHLSVRRLSPGEPALNTVIRVPGDIPDRFAQGAVGFGAFRGDELLGWLWFIPGAYRDFNDPINVELTPPATTAWDFDIYVRPEARLTAAFACLWGAAFEAMRVAGVTQTLSEISAFNPASLGAHRRLGAIVFGSVLMLRLGRFQALCSRSFRPHLQWSLQQTFRARLVIAAPRRITSNI